MDVDKPLRQRSSKLENDLLIKENLLNSWNKGWNCFLETLNKTQVKDLERIIYIRNEVPSVHDKICTLC